MMIGIGTPNSQSRIARPMICLPNLQVQEKRLYFRQVPPCSGPCDFRVAPTARRSYRAGKDRFDTGANVICSAPHTAVAIAAKVGEVP